MKCLKATLLSVLAILSLSACSQNKSTNNMEKKKTLVVYFSATGTTKQVAEKLAAAADADICEIVPAQPYTNADLNWHDSRSRSSVEMADSHARPEIVAPTVNAGNYDTIFIGYPIWWDLAPRPVNTFVESVDLTGKTVIPFATSGGSSITGSVAALRKLYPKVKWQTDKLLNHASQQDIKTWLNK